MSWHDESESHIEMRAEMNERAGMSPEEARRAAEKSFGNRAMIGEEVRAVNVPLWLEQLGQDVRHAARGFARSPRFIVTALAVLITGIGAASAVFSFTDRILLRPLPYPNEHELVSFGMTAPLSGANEFILEQNYSSWRKHNTPFSGIAVSAGVNDCNLSEENPARLSCARVSASYLSVLGYRPFAGRDFSEEDGRPGAAQTALISRALWKERFGGGELSGKSLELDGNRTMVIGVLPENFEMPSLAKVDVLQVLNLDGNKSATAPSLLLGAIARMRPGVTVAQASADMEPHFQDGLRSIPRGLEKEIRFVILPLRDRQVRDSRRAALLLAGAVSLVLLIAVANVANLLLARAAARNREMAVRAAIGAARGRLARQALTESLLLGIMGGAGGLMFGAALLRLFRQLAPAGIARLDVAAIDTRVAAFSLLAAIMASILFGLAPALRSPAPEALTGGRVAGRRRDLLRPSLVAVQVAVSLVLLSGAALMLRSLRNMANAPLGMQTAALFSAYAQLPGARYPTPTHRTAYWNSITERLKTVPGVEAIAITDSLPPEGRAQGRVFSSIRVEGRPPYRGQSTGGMVTIRQVSPAYFPMLGVPLRQGRAFAEGESNPAVISETMANRVFPGEAAVGRRLVLTGEGTVEVVGVVADVRNGGLNAKSDPELYLLSNREGPRQYVLLRADTRVMPFVREVFRDLDPRLTIQFETLDDRVKNMRVRPRFQSMLLSGFALAGLILAAAGLYGVTALLTTQRTGEIGVRMALGASPREIRKMVLRQAGSWAAAGIVIGLCGAFAGSRWIEGLLYEVKPSDPLPLAAAVISLTFAVLLAAWLPARRASRVEPVEALRAL